MKNNANDEYLEITNWKAIRDKVSETNAELANIIDEFNPNEKYPLIKVKYPYGARIRHNGGLHLPISKLKTCSLSNYQNMQIQKYLSYSSSPIGLILNKAVEVYTEMPEGRVIPFKLFRKGVCFGVWEIMPINPIMLRQGWDWNISSGSRTIFMLPKISDAVSHQRLKHDFGIQAHLPNTIFEHQSIFKEITASKKSITSWDCDILFFTGKWFEAHPKNNGWTKLKEYWAKEAWQQMLYWSNHIYLDYTWEKFVNELIYRKIILKRYLLDTLKHIIFIGCGTIPGFRLADTNDEVAPISTIQKAYVTSYDLKNYAPLIMHADMLSAYKEPNCLYYSLQAPTLPVKPPEWKENPSAMKVLRELNIYIEVFKNVFNKFDSVKINNVLDFMDNIDFSFFHSDADKYQIVKSTSILCNQDKIFLEQLKKFPKKKFSESSPFLRGCIKVYKKTKTEII